MALIPRLELRQRQSLVMTPQLQKAIKLLQFSNLELREFVEKEMADNPLLELNDDDSFSENSMAEEHGAAATPDDDNGEDSEVQGHTDGSDSLDLKSQDHVSEDHVNALDMVEFDNVWEPETVPTSITANTPSNVEWGNENRNRSDHFENFSEQNISQKLSLREHLMNQIQIEIQDPKDRLIATFLTDHIDERGRLPSNLDDFSDRLGCNLQKMNTVLKRIQAFDPPGIFARSLGECWSIQLRDLDRLDPAMETLIENLELLKKHVYQTLAELCYVDLNDIKDMVNELWSLSHNPLDRFDQVVTQPITPDLNMRQGPEESWIVELNTSELPKVLVNNTYYAEISRKIRNKDEKQYITDKLHSANWLVKSLHQRAVTILKVASEIVSQQEKFFDHGVEYLRPLALRDIAEEVEMHESTISRVTSNKYIDTPRGIFELKYFFTTAIGSTNGDDDYSAEAVRHKIKSLIEDERSDSILSDDKLVEMLNDDGVEIARRTVAKYRDAMKIPSSIHRRKQKNQLAAYT